MFRKDSPVIEMLCSEGIKSVVETLLKVVDEERSVALISDNTPLGCAVIVSTLKKQRELIHEIDTEDLIGKSPDELKNILRNHTLVLSTEETRIATGQITKIEEYSLQLKTKDMEASFSIGKRISDELKREKVREGDVVKIYSESGLVTRIGRGMGLDNASDEILTQLPTGECFKTEKVVTKLTVAQVDQVNSHSPNLQGFYCTEPGSVDRSIRDDVDIKISRWIKEDKVTVQQAILMVHNANILRPQQITELMGNLNGLVCKPSVIFLCNEAPKHSRCLSLEIPPFSRETIANCLNQFVTTKNLKVDKKAIDFLSAQVGSTDLLAVLNYLEFKSQKHNITEENIMEYNGFINK